MHDIRCWWLEGCEPCERLHKDVFVFLYSSLSQFHTWQQIPVYISLLLLHFLLFVTSPLLPHKYRYTLSPNASFFCPLKDSDPLKALRCISVCRYGCVLKPLCLIWTAAFVKVEEREWEIDKKKKWHGKIETHIEDKSSALRSRDKKRTVFKICSLKEHAMRKSFWCHLFSLLIKCLNLHA